MFEDSRTHLLDAVCSRSRRYLRNACSKQFDWMSHGDERCLGHGPMDQRWMFTPLVRMQPLLGPSALCVLQHIKLTTNDRRCICRP